MTQDHITVAGSTPSSLAEFIERRADEFLKHGEPAYNLLGDELYQIAESVRSLSGDPAQPVAWRVKNDHGHWYVTQHKDLADTWRDFEGYEVQALYAAQPPAAPVEPSAWHCPACEAAVVVDDPTPAHECSSADRAKLNEVLELIEYQRRRYQDVRLNFKQMDLLLSYVQPQALSRREGE